MERAHEQLGMRSAYPPHVTEDEEKEDPEEDSDDSGANKDHDLHAAIIFRA